MQQMSSQKDTNGENIFLMMQLPNVTKRSLNEFTDSLTVTKPFPVIQNELNNVLSISSADKATGLKYNKIIPGINGMHTNTLNTNSNTKIITKVPVLKITINKRYNKPFVPNINQSTCTLNVVNNKEKSKPNVKIYHYLKDDTQNSFLSSKPVTQKIVPSMSKKIINYKNSIMETRNLYTPKFIYTRKGDLSRDQSRTQTSAERIQYLYTKAKRECNMLKMRLKALRERHLREKEEIKRLQIYLQCYYKNVKKEYADEMSEEYIKKSKLFMLSKNTEEQEKDDEYDKLLRKVRKIKQDISNHEILISKDCFGTILVKT